MPTDKRIDEIIKLFQKEYSYDLSEKVKAIILSDQCTLADRKQLLEAFEDYTYQHGKDVESYNQME